MLEKIFLKIRARKRRKFYKKYFTEEDFRHFDSFQKRIIEDKELPKE